MLVWGLWEKRRREGRGSSKKHLRRQHCSKKSRARLGGEGSSNQRCLQKESCVPSGSALTSFGPRLLAGKNLQEAWLGWTLCLGMEEGGSTYVNHGPAAGYLSSVFPWLPHWGIWELKWIFCLSSLFGGEPHSYSGSLDPCSVCFSLYQSDPLFGVGCNYGILGDTNLSVKYFIKKEISV